MRSRSRLHLRELLKATTGIANLYFQPPNKTQMTYPCIVYGHQNYRIEHANNGPYVGYKQYLVTIIDKNPDSEYPDKMLDLPFCRFDRHYSSDNLHHWVYSLYY